MLRDIREGLGLIGGALVALAVGLRPHHATSSPLFWFGVALLAIAGLALAGTIIGHFRSAEGPWLVYLRPEFQFLSPRAGDKGYLLDIGFAIQNASSSRLLYFNLIAHSLSINGALVETDLWDNTGALIHPHGESEFFFPRVPVGDLATRELVAVGDLVFEYGSKPGSRERRSSRTTLFEFFGPEDVPVPQHVRAKPVYENDEKINRSWKTPWRRP